MPGGLLRQRGVGVRRRRPGRLTQYLTELSETPGRFDLADYKTTPDWLNSRSWPYAERWDQDFW